MSKIGKTPISIPDGVEVKVKETKIGVKGPKGALELDFDEKVDVEVKDSQVIVKRRRSFV